MTGGCDDYRYEVVDGWGLGVDGFDPGGMITGVDTDSKDRLYAFRRNPIGDVLVYEPDGRFITSWGSGIFSEPHAISLTYDDRVFCADRVDHTVRVFSADGELLMTLGTPDRAGQPGMPFNMPTKAVVAEDGEIFTTDGYGQARIHRFSPQGALLLSWGDAGDGPGQFNLPHSLAVDKSGRIVVVDRENHRIQFFDRSGEFSNMWTGLRQPMDMCVDDEGVLYFAEAYQEVGLYTPDGSLLCRWGEKGTAPGQFGSFLHGICTDSRGDLYVADEGRLQKFARR